MKNKIMAAWALAILGALSLFAATKITGALIVNSTLLSPVVNGTPTGTGIPTTVLKQGTGSGNYGVTNTSFTPVDSTNLSYGPVTIPVGWTLLIQCSGSEYVASGGAPGYIAINDSVNGIIQAIQETSSDAIASGGGLANTTVSPFSLTSKIVGDGMSHTIQLEYQAVTSYNINIVKSSGVIPSMLFILAPSN